jgi:hypothetical protein
MYSSKSNLVIILTLISAVTQLVQRHNLIMSYKYKTFSVSLTRFVFSHSSIGYVLCEQRRTVQRSLIMGRQSCQLTITFTIRIIRVMAGARFSNKVFPCIHVSLCYISFRLIMSAVTFRQISNQTHDVHL